MKEVENLKTDNIYPIFKKSDKLQNSVLGQLESGIIKLDNKRKEPTMPQETYSKTEIDLKLDKLNSDVQHGFKKIDTKLQSIDQKMTDRFAQIDLKFEKLEQKIDFSIQHILSETKNMLLEQQVKEKTERENERKTTNRWLIGIAISLAGLIVSVIVNFFLRK